MSYDPAKDTNNQFFATGATLGSYATIHDWYGYSVYGIEQGSSASSGNMTIVPEPVSAAAFFGLAAAGLMCLSRRRSF